ncbi:MAG: transcriptional repressor LexA [Alphaproteobacteria bacterium]|nr:transcriptional repressor LexA [Alphaproteobacteria bacterium]MBO4643834.1 transcriptional repressor LexA [Alphaproteobacteria bacterium]
MLTKRQYQLLMLIEKKLREDGVSPSFEEMKEAIGLKSKSGIHRLISGLEERGFIRRLPNKARALEILRLPDNQAETALSAKGLISKQTTQSFSRLSENLVANSVELPRYGKIAAGTPIEALRSNETVSVPANMIGNGEHYALTVAGDSMIEAGILDGDTVIIQRANTVENGEIAVALVDGCEVTLKKIRRKGNSIMLEPCNRNYEARIYSPERITVQGKLVGLMRSYG